MKESIAINGMSCGGCVAGVKNALSSLDLQEYTVDIGRADVEYDESKVSHDDIVAAIEDAGYDVKEGSAA